MKDDLIKERTGERVGISGLYSIKHLSGVNFVASIMNIRDSICAPFAPNAIYISIYGSDGTRYRQLVSSHNRSVRTIRDTQQRKASVKADPKNDVSHNFVALDCGDASDSNQGNLYEL